MAASALERSAAQLVHYSPKGNPSGPRWRRVAVCGVTTRIGAVSPEHVGTANRNCVTCRECRRYIRDGNRAMKVRRIVEYLDALERTAGRDPIAGAVSMAASLTRASSSYWFAIAMAAGFSKRRPPAPHTRAAVIEIYQRRAQT